MIINIQISKIFRKRSIRFFLKSIPLQQVTLQVINHIYYSIENDLLVLKIVHNYVIDTSVCYKHPTPGYKHALRYLCSRYLNRSIQNQNGGHNSVEDARAALDLVIFYSMSVRNYCITLKQGISFKKSFEEVKPQPNKRSCLLQTISKANPRSRVVFMSWNDYIMNVSQTSSAGDMMVLKDSSTFLTKYSYLLCFSID